MQLFYVNDNCKLFCKWSEMRVRESLAEVAISALFHFLLRVAHTLV